MFIVNLVFLKLFIAIILEGYNKSMELETRLFNLEVSEKFKEVWSTYDPDVS